LSRAWISGEKISNSELDTTFEIFPHFFQHWQSSNSGPAGRMAGLQGIKKCGKIQNVVSSSDIFSWNACSSVKVGFVLSKATLFPYRCCILESLTNFHVAAATFVKVATTGRSPGRANWLFVDPINSLAQRWSSWDKVKLLLWKWEAELIHDIFSFLSPTFDEIPLAIHLASLYVSEPQKSQSLWGLLHAGRYCWCRAL